MRTLLTTGAIGLALALATLAPASAATARNTDCRSAVRIGFDFADVAFGYRDGYWDHHRRWHRWRRDSDRDGYRQTQGEYHEWYHTRDRHNQGWHGDNGRRD